MIKSLYEISNRARVMPKRDSCNLTVAKGNEEPRLKRALVVCICIGLSACATKTDTGGLAGGAIGAVVGSAIGGKKGALVGAVLGAAVGYSIGSKMDADDKRKLAAARAEAARSASSQSFYSPSTKAMVEVAPSAIIYKPAATIALAPDLVDRTLIDTPLSTQIAPINIPIYSTPSFDTMPKLVLAAGSSVTTIAQVQGLDDWVVVGSAGYGLGYVNKKMLDEKAKEDAAKAYPSQSVSAPETKVAVGSTSTGKPPPKPLVKAPAVSKPPAKNSALPTAGAASTSALLDGDAKYLPPQAHLKTAPNSAAAYQAGIQRGDEQSKRAIASGKSNGDVRLVSTNTECRDLTTVLLSDNKEIGREKTTACRKSDGAWAT
jgi:surface antigen